MSSVKQYLHTAVSANLDIAKLVSKMLQMFHESELRSLN